MKKTILCKLIALLLVACLLLSGCGVVDFGGYFRQLGEYFTGGSMTAFADMEYTRPDMEKMQGQLAAVEKAVADGVSVNKLMDKVYVFFELYYDFYTNYLLSNIYYSKDLTDTVWSAEYDFCMENSAWVDSAVDKMYRALAGSKHREALEAEEYFGADFFDDYDGESIWTEAFTALMEQEAKLISRYYALSAQASGENYYTEEFFTGTGKEMAELFVEMVALRQRIAAEAGYSNYPEFAYDYYYSRAYTPAEAINYMNGVRQELVGLYTTLESPDVPSCTQAQTYDFVKKAAQNMGGKVKEAFRTMEDLGLYDIGYDANKYNASFECYLYSYYVPFVFMNPSGKERDKLTFSHEFGHFCNDYASSGTQVGVDVAEFFSQSMEYLALCYGENTENLTKQKMMDAVAIYVEQSAYATFEQQVYGLTGDKLTVENVYDLYDQVGTAYGFGKWNFDRRDFVMITHYFTNPMYIVSYVVSNDAALQVYQMEKALTGSGLKLLQDNLATQEEEIVGFAQAAGLKPVLDQSRLAGVRQMLEGILG